jgi:hypothetical protein
MTAAMIRPVAISPGAMQFAVIPNGEILRQISRVMRDSRFGGS